MVALFLISGRAPIRQCMYSNCDLQQGAAVVQMMSYRIEFHKHKHVITHETEIYGSDNAEEATSCIVK